MARQPRKRPALPYIAWGKKFQDLLAKTQWNLTEFAIEAGIATSYPSKFARGESRAPFDKLPRIAHLLKADYDELAALCGYLYIEDRPVITGWGGLAPSLPRASSR